MITFSSQFFTHNRKQLYTQLKSNSFVALTANGQMQRSSDQAYGFEQEPNFWYLTGINHADWWLLADADSGEEWLVAPQLERYQEIFDGSLSADNAMQKSGVGRVIDRKAGRELLRQLLAKKKLAYTLRALPRRMNGFYSNRAQYDLVHRLRGVDIKDIRLMLTKLRAIKQPQEIAAIQEAIDITGAGLAAVVKQLSKLRYEYEVEALLTYEFRRRGYTHAFDPVVASGKNTCTVHYAGAQAPLDPPFLLFDVGAQAAHYAADIARVVPLGELTKRQEMVWQAVVRVRDATIALLKPGAPVQKYLKTFEAYMRHELVMLGVLDKSDTTRESVYTWMPHAITHGLGVDVHDPLGRPEHFEAGMVLTVEPGIYIPNEAFGVRLEEDVLITQHGPKILSENIPLDLRKQNS